MSMFSRVEGGQVLLTNRGVYQDAELYKRGDELFARIKNGFARLLTTNLTTAPGIRWKAIDGIPITETPEGPRQVIPAPVVGSISASMRKKLRAI